LFIHITGWCRTNGVELPEAQTTNKQKTLKRRIPQILNKYSNNIMDSVTIRLRKVMRNPLLGRKQAVVECIHPNKANVSKKDAAAKIAKMMKVSDINTIFMFGFRTGFGGGKSKGFVLIYDNVETAKKFEPKYRLIRNGLLEKVETSKKQKTEKKNRDKKFRGTGVRLAKRKAKRAAE
jgi:small subunit ribosomal protein S24e